MIVRIWTTEVVKERVEEYKVFASSISMPMFKQFEGLVSVQICLDEQAAISKVITTWQGYKYIEQMENSTLYQETVKSILAAGFLTSQQSIEVLPVFDSFLQQ